MYLPEIDFDAHPAYCGLAAPEPRPPKAYTSFLADARQTNERFRINFAYPNRRKGGTETYGRLVADGIVGFHLSKQLINGLRALAAPMIGEISAVLENHARGLGDSNLRITSSDLSLPSGRIWLNAVAAIENETQFIAMSSDYMGCEAGFKVAHVKVEDSRQAELSGKVRPFADTKLPDPAARYFHIDSTCFDMKLIIYLSDVEDERDGPFSFVLGSADERIGYEEFIARVAGQLFTKDRTLENRRLWMQLPANCRKRLDFGSDLADNVPLNNLLLSREKVFTTADANAVLFDTSGVHRGAMISRGQRQVLQISLQGTG
jgi:hypothetical protein